MNANRTKILSTAALIAILLIQMFWMWNTYNINARQLGKEYDEILKKTIALELDKTNRCDSFFESGDTVAYSNIYNSTLSLYDAIYKKSHQDANIDTLTIIADSIIKAEKLPFRIDINKVNMKTGKVIEGKNINSNIFPFLEEVKTNILPVRLDYSVGFQMTITNGSIYIIRHNWVLLLISILISIVIILSLIDQINYIDEQERVRLLREDFSYAMVHDMKSPLTSIIMGTKYLHSGVLEKKPEMKEKYFCIVEDEAQHLLALINRLLTISKLEHGKLHIQKAEVNLEAMIEDVLDKYKAKTAKPIHITTLFGATSALADEEYLKEAISNLVDNATKYSKEEINIEISTLENDKYVYIKVFDEGIGIAKSELKTIFNRFERAAEHEKDARKTRGGFGIGLNYVLQVINAHGGKISVKSEKDKWSEFTISLPK
jgi:signal transduction histidine kinase